ncbi:MAG: hypothetical protein ACFCD0_26980 [Gemmataceae bacterium]
MAKHLYLAKASDDLVSHCRCDPALALVSSPGQMDCPWCGCGWLFICSRCRRAFSFARIVEVNESWEHTAVCVLQGMYRRDPIEDEIAEWVDSMQMHLEELDPDQEYVYFDSWFLSTKASSVRLEGLHSQHALPYVPQVAALKDASIRSKILENKDYWMQTAVVDDDE